MKYLSLLILPIIFLSCSYDLKKDLKKNPKIITDYIRENPEKVMQALNDAAKTFRKKS